MTPPEVVDVLRRMSYEELDRVAALLRSGGGNTHTADTIDVWLEEQADLQVWPDEPPPTPDGDRVALEAAHRLNGLLPITDPELARWLAESPALSNDEDFRRVPGIRVWMPD